MELLLMSNMYRHVLKGLRDNDTQLLCARTELKYERRLLRDIFRRTNRRRISRITEEGIAADKGRTSFAFAIFLLSLHYLPRPGGLTEALVPQEATPNNLTWTIKRQDDVSIIYHDFQTPIIMRPHFAHVYTFFLGIGIRWLHAKRRCGYSLPSMPLHVAETCDTLNSASESVRSSQV